MRIRSLAEVARLANASLVRGMGTIPIRGAVIDSRVATEGSIFFALPGSNCHGMEHADEALKKGASAVMCDSGLSSRHSGPSLEVADVHSALVQLASRIRQQEEFDLPVVAVTGSAGKTTTCVMISALLGETLRVHSPQASYNNKIGVPITILESDPDTESLILELGSNAPGEIAELTEIAKPSHGVITAIAEAHLEGLGSIEGVLREKFSLLELLEGDGLWAPVEWRDLIGKQGAGYRWTGPSGDLEIRSDGSAGVVVMDRCRSREFSLPWIPPTSWALRCLESAVAMALEVVDDPDQVALGAQQIQLPRWRHEVHNVEGIDLILDCYNSNPRALQTAIDDLGQSDAPRKLVVLGTMEELGKNEKRYHVEAGHHCVRAGIDVVFVSGRAADWIGQGVKEAGSESISITEGEHGARIVKDQLRAGDRVLFKASRKEQLEQIALLIEQQLQVEGAGS
ncbi:MAG: hypothetical protein CMJ95_14240 [Planctomycetes bacterium]|nr:hypothetical protein [Planctomycetota bacterium]